MLLIDGKKFYEHDYNGNRINQLQVYSYEQSDRKVFISVTSPMRADDHVDGFIGLEIEEARGLRDQLNVILGDFALDREGMRENRIHSGDERCWCGYCEKVR